jgi:hypothetical protein
MTIFLGSPQVLTTSLKSSLLFTGTESWTMFPIVFNLESLIFSASYSFSSYSLIYCSISPFFLSSSSHGSSLFAFFFYPIWVFNSLSSFLKLSLMYFTFFCIIIFIGFIFWLYLLYSFSNFHQVR